MSAHGRKDIVIVGASGFGREVMQYALETYGTDPAYRIKGFLDDRPPDLGPYGLPYPVLAGTQDYQPQAEDRLIIALGDPKLRAMMADRFSAMGASFLTIVHPRAYVSGTATVGRGCIVGPFATVGPYASLGEHSLLTYYASVGHDVKVGRCCALSPHSVANGGSSIGDLAFLGAHAVVNPMQQVGDGAKVAAGAVVYRPVPAGALAAGNPATSTPLG